MERLHVALVLVLVLQMGSALDNGLALTPPMGWLSWERYRCETDCETYPDSCINENLYMRMADKLVELGLKDLGYVYVNIDDCWLAHDRDPVTQKLVPDPERFPSGIKALSDYMHARGLKLGIYEDFGSKTCAGYPGSEFFLELDANTFAEWNVDMLKFDGCNSDAKDMPYGYPAMQRFLNMTGHPMLFSCEWPLYDYAQKVQPDYKAIKERCNIWRNYQDMQDSWDKVTQIIDYFGKNAGLFAEVAGPGGFNDPDMSNYTAIRAACNMWRNYGDVTDAWTSVTDIVNYFGKNHDNFSKFTGPGGWADPDMIDNYTLIRETCNLWRNYWDVTDSWDSVVDIINYYGFHQTFAQYTGPGGWADPDMANFTAIRETCNMWRDFEDVTDSWDNVAQIINYYGYHSHPQFTGPGGWPDPDELVVGDFGLSYEQQKAQFGMWAMFSAPLFMSNDLYNIDDKALSILKNKEVLAINQDPLGAQGVLLFGVTNSITVWFKPLSQNRTAIAFLNQDNQGRPTPYSLTPSDLGLTYANGYNVTDTFEGKSIGVFKPTTPIKIEVNPTSIVLLKLTPMPGMARKTVTVV